MWHTCVFLALLALPHPLCNTLFAPRCLQRLAPEMPYTLLRESLMPRVVGLCLRTTSLVVRTSALALMAQAAHRLDKEAAAAMLDVCSQVGPCGQEDPCKLWLYMQEKRAAH